MNTMLLHDFAYVPLSAARVRDRILADHGEWLAPLATAAADDGEALRLRIGPLAVLPMLGKTVSVHVGQPIDRGEITVVPLTWQATSAPGLFPVLSADLEVAGLGDDLTQLTLQGRYDPPLGCDRPANRPAADAPRRRGECPELPRSPGRASYGARGRQPADMAG